MTEDQLQTTLSQISFVGLVALDEMLSGGDRGESMTLGDTVADSGEGPVAAFEVEEMRQILADAINRMPEREKIVLTLYYYEGLTLAEIGEVLGVTESRVCQIHTKAVLQLRSRLAASEREPAYARRGGAPSPTPGRCPMRAASRPCSCSPRPARRPPRQPVTYQRRRSAAPVSDPFRAPATPYGPGNRGLEYATAAGRGGPRGRRPAR